MIERAKSFENFKKKLPVSEESPADFHLTLHKRLIERVSTPFSQSKEVHALASNIAGGDSDVFEGFLRKYLPRLIRFTLTGTGRSRVCNCSVLALENLILRR